MTGPLAHLRPDGTVTAAQLAALVLDIFAAIEAEHIRWPDGRLWGGSFNTGVRAALDAAGDAVRRHGLTVPPSPARPRV